MAVFQRGKTWYYKFKIKGRVYYKAVPEATSRKDAENAETRVKSDLLQDKYDLAEGVGEMTWKDLTIKFEKYAESNRISWERSDAHMVKTINNFFCNSIKLREITPFLIERYRLSRLALGRARSTINKEVRLIRRIFNMAIDNRWANYNPCSSKKVKPYREENKLEYFLGLDEEESLISVCTGEYSYARSIIVTALQTGMRKEEILSLKWENVDLEKGLITILQTKSGKKRSVPISSTLMEELSSLNENKTSEYLFVNPRTKTRYEPTWREYKKLFIKANIENLTFHSLRHTAATRMVAAGIDLVSVKEILGHADIKSTMVYSHPMPERKKLAVEALANFSKQKKNIVSIEQKKAL